MDFNLEDYEEEQNFILNNPATPTLKLMRGFAKQYHNKQLTIPNVSQQRELLLAYEIYNASENDKKNNMEYLENLVDTYLANNCG